MHQLQHTQETMKPQISIYNTTYLATRWVWYKYVKKNIWFRYDFCKLKKLWILIRLNVDVCG